jgi:hypothetical protein
MKKIKAFFYVYFKSLTSLTYYQDILKTNFNFSVKYYVFLAVMASLIGTLGVSMKTVPEVQNWVSSFMQSVKNAYPNDLVLTIKNNEWDINKPQPFIFPLPQAVKNEPKNILVLYKDGTINDLESLDTMILINKVNMIYRENSGIKVLPLKDLPDATLGKTEFENIINNFNKIAQFIPVFMGMVVFISLLFFYFTIRIMYLVFVGACVWIASKITKTALRYDESLRIGLHAFTLPLTINLLLDLFGVAVPYFGLLLFAVNIVFVIAILKSMNKSH